MVVIIARTHDEEPGMVDLLLAIYINSELPQLLIRGPVGGCQFLVELHVTIDAVFGGRFRDVFHDRGAAGNRALLWPRSPREAKRVEI